MKRRDGNRYEGVPVVVTDPAKLEVTGGNLHCATPNLARCLKEYAGGGFDRKVAVVCKPCDARAIIELAKRKQVNLENLLLIGLNCTGTMLPNVAKRMYIEEFGIDPADVKMERIFPPGNKFFAVLNDGREIERDLTELEAKGFGRRENCRRCEINIPRMADIACGKWGTHGRPVSFVEICSDKGAAFWDEAVNAGVVNTEEPGSDIIQEREKFDQAAIQMAREWQDKLFGTYRQMDRAARVAFWFDQFNQCIKCYGCRDACPICYCRECRLDAGRGTVPEGEVPPGALFGLTRAMHVADSCVNCGQCQDVCPANIPLSSLIGMIQQEIQAIFNYEPGVNPAQRPPLAVIEPGEVDIHSISLAFN
ncbi:MAG TPA: formate dehydrogenase [Peptococcaceae bacterium]|nr:formate dehydrogenase [Peptococcaceae bacterium]